MTELEKNCVLLVNTCDAYSDCWDGFFQLLRIQWPSFSMPVVLNTESKSYTFDGFDIRTVQASGKREEWGGRLIRTLKSIDTKYVLFALDDFYLDAPVRVEELEKCFGYMEQNPEIAYFSFHETTDPQNTKSTKYPGFEKRPQKGDYRLNCQFALWNREYLISYIRPHESPWEWELYGSKRSARYHEEMYTICADTPPVFSYQNGAIIMRGRWYLERVLPLIEKYHLSIDLSKRESYEEYRKRNPRIKRNLIRGIKRRIHKILSLI